jgi:hypothetical protein
MRKLMLMWLVLTLLPWLDDPRVRGVVFFALDGHPDFWGHTNLLVLDQQGQVLDTYAPFDLFKSF